MGQRHRQAENARDECGGKKFVLLDTERGGRGAQVADAVRYINGADHLWTAEDRDELREQEKSDARNRELLLEFDVVYARTSRDRVIIRRMIANLARERENVFVEMEELEKFI